MSRKLRIVLDALFFEDRQEIFSHWDGSQFIPCGTIVKWWYSDEGLILELMSGFSIEIDDRSLSLASDKIQFKHTDKPCLNFNLTMSWVKRIYSDDGRTDFRLRFAKQ